MKNIAIYPGSFDPFSNGHLDILQRASRIFEEVIVLVSINPNKTYVFNADERVAMIKKIIDVKHLTNVTVEASEELVTNFAIKKQATVMIRGIRNHNDMDAELTLFQFNHVSAPTLETVLLFPEANNLFLSSSAIKELVIFGNSIKPYVPECLEQEIYEKISQRLDVKKYRDTSSDKLAI